VGILFFLIVFVAVVWVRMIVAGANNEIPTDRVLPDYKGEFKKKPASNGRTEIVQCDLCGQVYCDYEPFCPACQGLGKKKGGK
jgi:hypothetical protein